MEISDILAQQKVADTVSPGNDPKIAEAAKGFEGYFIQLMLQEMRKTVPKTEKSGFGDDIFESLFDQALAQKMAENPGIGLAKQIRESLEASSSKKDGHKF